MLPARLRSSHASPPYLVQEENWDEDGCFEPARIYRTAVGGGKGQGPGLAMTRSLGDFDAASIGVIGTPTVSHRALQAGDAFIVLASDGIWEFLTSERVVEIVEGYLKRGESANTAARYLIALASLEWKREEGGSYRDDITATVVFLKDLLPVL